MVVALHALLRFSLEFVLFDHSIVRLVGAPYAILVVPTFWRQALHYFKGVAASTASAGLIAYRLSNLEFVIAHVVIRSFVSRSLYHELIA